MSGLAKLGHLIAAQDWAGAEAVLRREAARKDAPAQIFYNLAKVLEAAGRPEQMGHWLTRAVKRDPGYAIAWFELGRVKLAGDQLEEARAAFARALALDHQDADAARNLMRLALRLGHWEEAANAAHRLGADPEALATRYRAASELGHVDEADHLRNALLHDPANRAVALKALTRVAKGQLPMRLPGLGEDRGDNGAKDG
ncbi:tetratricopeptide repeat protein [Thioclava pacifica]|uniref:Uncharacterized protein n=1 Tax=Thioclava pacifica DSM 10166 TaxID=1353537 RepID=A0A074JIY1_9RHOB|nr:tetratricopeptide repeat protein [Thioclava pacifica]KEO56444.1 hypothetical protein TP2_02640 [Thioclava pacifica DSM 10166]